MNMKALSFFAIGMACAVLPGVAAAQSTAPVVSGRTAPVDSRSGAPAQSCRTHQTGVSDCTHDRGRSRRVAAAWLGATSAQEARMTATDWADIDAMLAEGMIIDRRTGNALVLRQAGPEELVRAGGLAATCSAATAPAEARTVNPGNGGVALKTHSSFRTWWKTRECPWPNPR